MIEIALFQPEIPPNTGNIIRLCANTGAALHLIGPLGFSLDDRRMRRAGLDYRDMARVTRHADYAEFLAASEARRIVAMTTRGERSHADWQYQDGDVLLYGPETRGLPDVVLDGIETWLRIPMRPGSRSLNLANAVAVTVYEAWRQMGYINAEP
ncbi:MAG: tRNA (uridine(34)/cytosine(34)/5-carboxymethylaminomethyluridine(34)-2'-O)-methyltransferase TrmL [Xanthomonadales bacterium]|nr:tRNA (uridine(34)/cytosine(34)/5-carboxymethylaminomethyluridine(34)-2'-O)-methyltransferase TrmL [Xanthomonadales bacterium]